MGSREVERKVDEFIRERYGERWNRPFTGSLPSPAPDSSNLPERVKKIYPIPSKPDSNPQS